MTITQTAVRRILLAAQGLSQPPAAPAQKPDVLAAIRRMGALQIDTIHVVARSPYLVLWSRLGAYEPEWLDQHLAEGRLFEYWSHAACFLPIEDYPLYRARMLDGMAGWYGSQEWLDSHPQVVEKVLSRLRAEGPLRSADFENENHKSGGWWDWKEEKDALESLLVVGRVMARRRDRFQRVYDLTERVLPAWDDAAAPPLEDAHDAFTLKSVRALGVAHPAWVHDYFRLKKTGIAARLERLADAGDLLRVDVEGWDAPGYLHPDNAPLLDEAASGGLEPTLTTILSPFDPLTWDRERARMLFNFDYTIECYTPAAKRIYGYFSLPILHRGALVGRLDAKAHRKEGRFEVRSLHLEPGVAPGETLRSELLAALQRLAGWHNTPNLELPPSSPLG